MDFEIGETSVFLSHSYPSNSFSGRINCNKTVDTYQSVDQPALTESNRNKPITCVYTIRFQPELSEWSVSLRFTKFRAGEVSNARDKCDGGYFQIIDGYKDYNFSDRVQPGKFVDVCAELA